MARATNLAIGLAAENLACRHLRSNGLREITRNYRCRMGEIDLIMSDRGTLIIVEVRQRNHMSLVPAACSVDSHKQRKLILAALSFLGKNPGYADWPMRFDVIAIETGADAKPTIEWIQDAFRPD